MLSSIATELQTHILSYLPRKDLAAVARVSQHLHAVAIKILYLKVELKSWDHLESFFLPGSLIPSGSISATEHAEARRKHWDSIKDLSISIRPSDQRSTKFLIPRSLRGRNVQPLQIERLRHSCDENSGLLLPLLECLNPKEVFSLPARCCAAEAMIYTLSKVGGWTRLDGITLALDAESARHMVPESDKNFSPSFFVGVTSGTVVLEFVEWTPPSQNGLDAVSFALRLLPSLQHLRIVFGEQRRKTTLESLLKNGFGGKDADFFTVDVGNVKSLGFD